MYQYNEQDRTQLKTRSLIFQRQIERNLAGKISDEKFRPLRLQQGLYYQRQSPMLRVAVPYGMLASKQLRTLAKVARNFDEGYCHITTRQNIQFNWVNLQAMPEILATLAEADLHSIQTSGNCIRNITSDPFAGVAQDEIIDPRPYCEIIRQWSLGHPEFAYLPRKFKIAISGSKEDRAITQAHDIGLRVKVDKERGIGFQVIVGGGLGRTPVIGSTLELFVPEQDILDYLTAILRVYNQHGRRDNKYKSRIKILVKSIGITQFKHQIDQTLVQVRVYSQLLHAQHVSAINKHFPKPCYRQFETQELSQINRLSADKPAFDNWLNRNTQAHKVSDYRAVSLPLKNPSSAPGDVSAEQLDRIADLADRYSFGEVRSTHQQNLVMADVAIIDLFDLWLALDKIGLAEPNIGTMHDIICCPGLTYCSLANTESIPIAQSIQKAYDDLDFVYDLGELTLNISGCMNACSHHHLANIGILGVDKKGQQFFQISLGGSKGNESKLGKILGPSVSAAEVTNVIKKIIHIFRSLRLGSENFIDTFTRVGLTIFKEGVYGHAN